MRLDLRQFSNHWGNLVDILNKVRILAIFNDVRFAHWIVMTNKYHFQHVSRVTFHCKLFVWFTEYSFGRTRRINYIYWSFWAASCSKLSGIYVECLGDEALQIDWFMCTRWMKFTKCKITIRFVIYVES